MVLAAACGRMGRIEKGPGVIAETLVLGDKSGTRIFEAELYRLAGELLLRIGESGTSRRASWSSSPILSPSIRFPVSSPEEHFLKVLEIARRQSAKSLAL